MRSRRHAHHESEACVKQDTPNNIAAEGAAGSYYYYYYYYYYYTTTTLPVAESDSESACKRG